MRNLLIYPIGYTDALQYAVHFISKEGIQITDHPTPEITHLLLDVPSFAQDGTLRGGGDIVETLRRLPVGVTVVGGYLNHPALDTYKKIDLLMDAHYLYANAAITADCALRIAGNAIKTTFSDSPSLIIGWGRIGKCLGLLLQQLGCPVTIAARNASDRAMIHALRLNAVDIPEIPAVLPSSRILFNTVPELILREEELSAHTDCVKIELASKTGIEGTDVIIARGLPGRLAPESSGKLIAQTFFKDIRR